MLVDWLDVGRSVMARAVRFQLFCSSSPRVLSTCLIPEIAINYRVAQNKRTPSSLFKFVVQHWFKMSSDVNRGSKNRNSLQFRVLEIEFLNSKLDFTF